MTIKQMKRAIEKAYGANNTTFFESGNGRRFALYSEVEPDTAPALGLGATIDKIETKTDDNGTFYLAFYEF